MKMETKDLDEVLVGFKLEIPNVLSMDDVQCSNIEEMIQGIIGRVIVAIQLEPVALRVVQELIPELKYYYTALDQLRDIKYSPWIEISTWEPRTELITVRICEIFDPNKGDWVVNLSPTDEFLQALKVYVEANLLTNSERLRWFVINTPYEGEINMREGEVTRVHPMNAEGLMYDYALWVGNSLVPSAGSPINPDVDLKPTDLNPIVYIQEFMEMAWQPTEEVVREFLQKFQYTQQTIDDLCEEIVWDNEAND